MAKKSSIAKNKYRQQLSDKFHNRRYKLKAFIMNKDTSIEERFDAQLKLSKLPRNSSKVRIRNRCELSGRPRGYYRKFRISRIALRDLASIGHIPGILKSSW